MIDKVTALIILLLLSPVILTILMYYLVAWEPVLFRQTRTGLRMSKFTLLKFRTLQNDKHIATSWFTDLLRKSSLDELPQLINVLQGNMSIIGPRPLLPEYDKLYNSNQLDRFNVKPGITGLAQVSGRNALSWEKRLSLDIDYVQNQSFLLDLFIFVKTFLSLFKWKEASSFQKFTGHN